MITIEDVGKMDDVAWSVFGGGLIEYALESDDAYLPTMTVGEVYEEIWNKRSIEELVPELKSVAIQYFYTKNIQRFFEIMANKEKGNESTSD